ncbi:hypothetical protein NY78_3790 [Desulfovibrio sp. TomC]|nr:hypothetical protein NY78_3790 [Desulfovibrio sp. TomC]
MWAVDKYFEFSFEHGDPGAWPPPGVFSRLRPRAGRRFDPTDRD